MTTTAPQTAVITPTRLLPERIPYLLELHASLQRQDTTWQWILALDGASPTALPAQLQSDPRVRPVVLPRPVGAGSARNFALNEVDAIWCTTADDDDRLPDGSLYARLRHARQYELAWCAGWSADLHPDGTTTTWRCPTPPGIHQPGQVWRHWASPDATIPLGPTTLLARTDPIRATGGYAALPQGEDYIYYPGTLRVPLRSCRLTPLRRNGGRRIRPSGRESHCRRRRSASRGASHRRIALSSASSRQPELS